MSRSIKIFPDSKYLRSLGESDISLQLTADQVETLKFPHIASNNVRLPFSFLQIKAYAKEDKKGIFVYLAEIHDDKETGKVSETIIVDEEEFADALFNLLENNINLEDSDYLRKILADSKLVSFMNDCFGALGGHLDEQSDKRISV